VDRLMRLIEGSQCVPGEEFDIELALREALENAVVHGNQEDPKTKVHIRCRCQPGNEISIVMTDQGKGFDFKKTVGNGPTSDPASGHGRLMKAFMDDVHFELADRQVDPNTGTIRIVAAFPNPGNILRPGQYGRVRVETDIKKPLSEGGLRVAIQLSRFVGRSTGSSFNLTEVGAAPCQ
jgi:anti-sigma regulatory factor (Ser/Thr protein kinase)